MSRTDLTDDDLDQRVRAAAAALAALAPDRSDGLAAKVDAELAHLDRASLAVEPRMTSDTEPKPGSAAVTPPAARSEDSGLHDIKALASDTRKRISRRTTSQHDILPEDLLSTSGSLRAVALPEPAMVVALPDAPSTMDDVRAAVANDPKLAAAIAAAPVPRRKTGLWVGAGAAAIAAAAAVVIVAGGGGDKGAPRSSAGAGSSQTALAEDRAAKELKAPAVVVAADPGAVGATAAGAGSAAQVPAMAPPPPVDPAAAPPVTGNADVDRPARPESAVRAGGGSDKPGAGSGRDAVRGAGGGSGSAAGGKNAGDGKAAPGGGGGAGSGKPAGGGSADGEKSIEDLLNDASGGGGKPKDTGGGGGGGGGDAPKGPEKTKLEPAEIKAGMSSVAGAAQACFGKHGVAGHVKVKAVVAPSGSVTKVDATGEFAGTPTGGCVAGAVKGASFPAWTGAPMTVTYSFTLQE